MRCRSQILAAGVAAALSCRSRQAGSRRRLRPTSRFRPPRRRPADVGSIDGMIRAYYDVITRPARAAAAVVARPDALHPGRALRRDRAWTATGKPVAADHAATSSSWTPRTPSMVAEGIRRARDPPRDAAVRQHRARLLDLRDAREAGRPGPRARHQHIELFWDGKRWWIASAIWDEERPDNPIPKAYLP